MEWIITFSFFFSGCFFCISLFLINKVLSKSKKNSIKLSIYESGEETVGDNSIAFNQKYLLVAFVFVLFEIEVLLLYPWSLAYVENINSSNERSYILLIEFITFIFLLLTGLIYVYKLKIFEWGLSNPPLKKIKIPEIYSKFNEIVK
jgi:NADH-quinone oxidoreductase subunit A